MTVERALRVLLRRWIVVVIGAALSLGAAAYFYMSTDPTYRAAASILLLLPPGAQDEEADGSPFLYLPSGLDTLARVVGSGAQSTTFAEDLAARGLASTFEVTVERASPIIDIEVEGQDAENVLATRDVLVAALEDELARVQQEEEVPEVQTARSRVFAADEAAIESGGDRQRAALAAVAAGGVLTVVAALALDWILAGGPGRSGRQKPSSPPSS